MMYPSMRRTAAAGAAVLLAGSAALLAASPAGAEDAPAGAPAAPAAAPAAPKGKVVARLPLSIREQPTSTSTFLGALKPGTVVELSCKKHGQKVEGNDLWYLLATKPGYVAARYVQNLSPVPACNK
ncbi:SH3 domain-containing protein [Streptomyces sp. NPDC020799]|uniref:SH3 domain-containing protein n=1 Tax=Streptomyces sp. NPDC020799 TaxID=3365091 RepID=UPI003795CBF3